MNTTAQYANIETYHHDEQMEARIVRWYVNLSAIGGFLVLLLLGLGFLCASFFNTSGALYGVVAATATAVFILAWTFSTVQNVRSVEFEWINTRCPNCRWKLTPAIAAGRRSLSALIAHSVFYETSF